MTVVRAVSEAFPIPFPSEKQRRHYNKKDNVRSVVKQAVK